MDHLLSREKDYIDTSILYLNFNKNTLFYLVLKDLQVFLIFFLFLKKKVFEKWIIL